MSNNSKFCNKCGNKLKISQKFCNKCGSQVETEKPTEKNGKLLIVLFIGLITLILFSMLLYSINTQNTVTTNNNSEISISNENNQVDNTLNWHILNSYNGVTDDTIAVTTKGSKTRVVLTAMPLKNYATNDISITIMKNNGIIGQSTLSWGSTSAVATKSKTFEFEGSGTYYIDLSAYELDYWNVEIYELD